MKRIRMGPGCGLGWGFSISSNCEIGKGNGIRDFGLLELGLSNDIALPHTGRGFLTGNGFDVLSGELEDVILVCKVV